MRGWRLGLLGLVVGLLLVGLPRLWAGAPSTILSALPPVTVSLEPEIEYQAQALEQATVHLLRIPTGDRFEVTPAVADELETVASFAAQSGAIAVLNAGFFDPANGLSTSYVIQAGQVVADPRQNDRLMENPDLTAYLDRILNRSELRRYRCAQAFRYDIAPRQDPAPAGCELVDAVGGGPRLLPELALQAEAFTDGVDGVTVRDALGSRQPNARTAIGIAADNSLIWVMVAQQPSAPGASGISLPALAALLHQLGAVQALNLDGGSSSGLYYDGETFYGRVDAAGNPIVRPVKSVLLLQSTAPQS